MTGMIHGSHTLFDLYTTHRMTSEAALALRDSLGIKQLFNVRVDHCPFAYAAVIDAVDGWRLVYSGDTRPSERLIQVSTRHVELMMTAFLYKD